MSDDDDTPTDNIDRTFEVKRLARLSLADYDGERNAAHERLGVRVSTLDRLVMAERAKMEKEAKEKQEKTAKEDEARSVGEYGPTEDAVAAGFVDLFVDRFRFDHSADCWFLWDGALWRKDATGAAYEIAREYLRDIRHRDTGKKKFIDAIERFARTDQRVAVTHEIWNRNLLLLGTPAGTVDLVSGEIREPQREDFITKSTLVAPGNSIECPQFLEFMEWACGGDHEMIRFIQQFGGYCLTGSVKEHALLFLYGEGGNGKSVFQNVLAKLMGDYAKAAPMEMLISQSYERHPTDLAGLVGMRLVTASETEEDRAWAEAKIRQMTGGDRITARFMRKDFFSYQPSFKLLIVGNHMPRLQNVNDAMRRRFKVGPFVSKPATVDRDLEEKLIGLEGPEILRWFIDGCLDWQRNGLIAPPRVIKTTSEYFDDQDLFRQWLNEMCRLSADMANAFEPHAYIYASWALYCEASGEKPGSKKALTTRLRAKGCTPDSGTHGLTIMRGILLTAAERKRIEAIINSRGKE